MRLPGPIVALVLVASTSAFAAPSAERSLPPAPATTLVPVALGCGTGRTRDALGRCHHPFNRFSHQKQFRHYKRTHCTPVRTPHGPVGFCKI